MNIKLYARRLDKDQTTIREVGVGCGNPEKTQMFVEQMYECNMFTEREMIEWEANPEENKTWALAKSYFGDLYVKKRSYQEDMKETKGGYESANGNPEKTQIFVEQMYEWDMFTEREMIEWEENPEENKHGHSQSPTLAIST